MCARKKLVEYSTLFITAIGPLQWMHPTDNSLALFRLCSHKRNTLVTPIKLEALNGFSETSG